MENIGKSGLRYRKTVTDKPVTNNGIKLPISPTSRRRLDSPKDFLLWVLLRLALFMFFLILAGSAFITIAYNNDFLGNFVIIHAYPYLRREYDFPAVRERVLSFSRSSYPYNQEEEAKKTATSISDTHKFYSLRYHNVSNMISSGLEALDRLEVYGKASFKSMHVHTDKAGIMREIAQALLDDSLMCELLGNISYKWHAVYIIGHNNYETDNSRKTTYDAYANNRKKSWKLAMQLVCKICPDISTAIYVVPSKEKQGQHTLGKAEYVNNVLYWISQGAQSTFSQYMQMLPVSHRYYYFHRPAMIKYGAHQRMGDSIFNAITQVANSYEHKERGWEKEKEWISNLNNADVREGIQKKDKKGPFYRLIASILELRSLFIFQNLETGFIPHVTYWHSNKDQQNVYGMFFGYSDSEHRFSDLTHIPLLSFALEAIVNRLHALDDAYDMAALHVDLKVNPDILVTRTSVIFLDYFAPRTGLLYKYWLSHRDPRNEGIVSIIHPKESGMDFSPLYDLLYQSKEGKQQRSSQGAAGMREKMKLNKEKIVKDNAFGDKDSRRHCTDCGSEMELYPKHLVQLYRYRQHEAWDLRKIFSSPQRFEVQDGGVNVLLAYNMHLLLDLVQAEWTRERERARHKFSHDDEVNFTQGKSISRLHRYERIKEQYQDHITLLSASSHDDGKRLDHRGDFLLDLDLSASAKTRNAPPELIITRKDALSLTKTIYDKFVQEENGNESINVASYGWSPILRQQILLDTDRVIHHFFFLLLGTHVKEHSDEYSSDILRKSEKLFQKILKELTASGGYALQGFDFLFVNNNNGCKEKDFFDFDECSHPLIFLLHQFVQKNISNTLVNTKDATDPHMRKTTASWGVPSTSLREECCMLEADSTTPIERGSSSPTMNWLVLEGLRRAKKGGVKGSDDLYSFLLQQWKVICVVYGYNEYYESRSGVPLGESDVGKGLILMESLIRELVGF